MPNILKEAGAADPALRPGGWRLDGTRAWQRRSQCQWGAVVWRELCSAGGLWWPVKKAKSLTHGNEGNTNSP